MVGLSESERQARRKLCLPLDGLQTIAQVEQRVQALASFVGLFKIGKESFVRFDPEIVRLVQQRGAEVFLVTPGIKGPATAAGADQKRVSTPGNALRAGAGILVAGRVISAAVDRVAAAREGLREMSEDALQG